MKILTNVVIINVRGITIFTNHKLLPEFPADAPATMGLIDDFEDGELEGKTFSILLDEQTPDIIDGITPSGSKYEQGWRERFTLEEIHSEELPPCCPPPEEGAPSYKGRFGEIFTGTAIETVASGTGWEMDVEVATLQGGERRHPPALCPAFELTFPQEAFMNPNLDTLLNLAEWNADPSVFYRGVNLWKTGRVMGDKEIESIFDTKSEHEGEILEYVAATDIFEIAATYAGALDVEWMVKMGSKKEDINLERQQGLIYVFRGEKIRALCDEEENTSSAVAEMSGFEVRPIEVLGIVRVRDGKVAGYDTPGDSEPVVMPPSENSISIPMCPPDEGLTGLSDSELIDKRDRLACELAEIEAELQRRATLEDEFTFDFIASERTNGTAVRPYVAKISLASDKSEFGRFEREFFEFDKIYGKNEIRVEGKFSAKDGDILEIQTGGTAKNRHRDFVVVVGGEQIVLGGTEFSDNISEVQRYLKGELKLLELRNVKRHLEKEGT